MLNRDSSSEQRRAAQEALYDALSEAFFDQVTFLTNPDNSGSGGTDVTSTTTFNVEARIPDTSNGSNLTHNGETRFRTNMYIGGAATSFEKADMYFLLLATWTSTTAPSTSSITGALTSFIGIHVNAGVVSIVAKDDDGFRENVTSVRMVGDQTYKLEIVYGGSGADIYVAGTLIGSASKHYNRTEDDIVLYPFIAPIRSVDGTGVRVNLENYQLIQKR